MAIYLYIGDFFVGHWLLLVLLLFSKFIPDLGGRGILSELMIKGFGGEVGIHAARAAILATNAVLTVPGTVKGLTPEHT